ncbi:MAG: WD40 repeat domain-containing protein, partial [bacterium]
MHSQNGLAGICRLVVAVAFVGVVVIGQAAVQGPLHGPSGEITLGMGTLVNTAYSPDGRYIATCGGLGAFLWDVETGEMARWFSGHTAPVNSVAFSPDGTKVLTGSYDRTAKLWDVESGAEIRTFSGHIGYVYSVVFSPDGTRVLTTEGDGTAKLWDAEAGTEIRTFSGWTWGISSVVFSPDGMKVLTGSYDGTAKLWDVESGAEIRTFSGYIGYVNSVAFSPDGMRVLTVGMLIIGDVLIGDAILDYTAQLWDVETGAEIRTFSGHTSILFSVAFSPDGTKVLTGSGDGTA